MTVSATVFPKRKQNWMQTHCSFKSAIEKSTKTMTEAQEKKSHGPYRRFLKDATWPNDAEGSHVHALCGSRRKYRPSRLQKKNSLYFWVPPLYASDTQHETLTLGNVQSENPHIVMASKQHIGLEGMAMKVRHNLDPEGTLIFLH